MAIKKIQMKPEGANDYADVLHPETSADVVLDTATKVIMTPAERTKLANLSKSDVGLSLVVNKDLSNVDNVKQMPIAGGTFTGKTIMQNNTDYTKQGRNITLSTTDASGGASGDVWIKYKP